MGKIVHAKAIGKLKVRATLELFDKQEGIVEVSQDPSFFYGWVIWWRDTGGTPFHWTGSAWERIKPVQRTWFDQLTPERSVIPC